MRTVSVGNLGFAVAKPFLERREPAAELSHERADFSPPEEQKRHDDDEKQAGKADIVEHCIHPWGAGTHNGTGHRPTQLGARIAA
jgi:hypothetical protein